MADGFVVPPEGAALPAPLANMFTVVLVNGAVRIAFSEAYNGNQPIPRTAVCLSAPDAASLAETITQLLQK